MPVSAMVELARMRGSISRRCSRISPPTMARMPANPPISMAKTCLAPWLTPSASQTAIGVSNPTKCPPRIISTPRWNSTDPMTNCLRRNSWLDEDFQLKGSVS